MPIRQDRRARPQSDDEQSVLLVFEGAGSTTEEVKYTSLATGNLEPGEYVLTLTLTDRHSGQSVSRSTNFMVAGG